MLSRYTIFHRQVADPPLTSVALARAIYGRFDTLILDDVFSALDADTESYVFNALFGPTGLLRDKPVIIATNQIYRLSQASWITMMQNSSIVEQGNYQTLIQLPHGQMAELVHEFVSEEKEGKASAVVDALSEPTEQVLQDFEKRDAKLVQGKGKNGRDTEVAQQGSVKWGTYLLYLRGMGRIRAGLWLLVNLLGSIRVFTSVYLQAWTTRLPNAPPSRYGAFLGGYAGLEVGYMLVLAIYIPWAFLFVHPVASKKLHLWQIQGVMRTSLAFFESRGVGQLINRFNSDLFTSQSLFSFVF